MNHSFIQDTQEIIRNTIQSKGLIRITGSGTKDWFGGELKGNPLSTKSYQGIINYQPDELVITVKSGTSLKEVELALEEKNQQFAFEPPYFGESATIGGMVCSGLAGPGRVSAGSLRDFVLGAKIMDGQGQVMNFGGTVMKNVAGYDVSRLMPGSLGTLALLLDVSIKVLPKAVATATLRLEIEQERAIHTMNLLASQPWPINASSWQGEQNGVLHIRLSGAKAAVESATSSFKKNLGMQLLDAEEAKIFWASLREQQSDWFKSANTGVSPLWRFAVAPTSKPLKLAGSTLIEWHGGQRWWQGKLDASTAKAIAAEADGHASIFRSSSKDASMLSSLNDNPLTKALVPVQERLQKAFDPHGIFATGRLA